MNTNPLHQNLLEEEFAGNFQHHAYFDFIFNSVDQI
jgi:hypothetical protein